MSSETTSPGEFFGNPGLLRRNQLEATLRAQPDFWSPSHIGDSIAGVARIVPDAVTPMLLQRAMLELRELDGTPIVTIDHAGLEPLSSQLRHAGVQDGQHVKLTSVPLNQGSYEVYIENDEEAFTKVLAKQRRASRVAANFTKPAVIWDPLEVERGATLNGTLIEVRSELRARWVEIAVLKSHEGRRYEVPLVLNDLRVAFKGIDPGAAVRVERIVDDWGRRFRVTLPKRDRRRIARSKPLAPVETSHSRETEDE